MNQKTTIKMSELIAIGLKYFATDSGDTYLLFNDGTEVWYHHREGCCSEYTPWEDDDFSCKHNGKFVDVIDDVKLPVTAEPVPSKSCLRRQ